MFFVEYTEYDTKKAINVALCYEIETYKHQTSSHGTFCIKLQHPKGEANISFKTEEHLDAAFKSLMTAIQESETCYWKVPGFEDV